MAVKFNAKGEVTLPFFQVGEQELDLKATIESIRQAQKAQRPR